MHRNIHAKLYSIGLFTGMFCGTTKINKILPRNSVEALLIQPIISQFNTTIYKIAHCLGNLLFLLSLSNNNTVSSVNDFVNTIKKQVIPYGYKLVLSDARSLFTCI